MLRIQPRVLQILAPLALPTVILPLWAPPRQPSASAALDTRSTLPVDVMTVLLIPIVLAVVFLRHVLLSSTPFPALSLPPNAAARPARTSLPLAVCVTMDTVAIPTKQLLSLDGNVTLVRLEDSASTELLLRALQGIRVPMVQRMCVL